jgi:hypothetical protein
MRTHHLDTLPLQAIAALQRLSDALWAQPSVDKQPILQHLTHADTILRRIRLHRVRPAALAAMQTVNPYITYPNKTP